MLTGLSIRDVVLIEALDLQFDAGLGALTGETGAGKSILLDALGLALGMRADSGLVRQGAERAVVSATFDLPPSHAVARLLDESGLDAEPGEPLIVRRIVKADGGSRASVNDQPVSATLLREIGGMLVEIHGQHDDRGLLNPKGHRALLDTFGTIDTLVKGEPGNNPMTLVYKVYVDGFRGNDLGGSSAQSVILMVLVLLLTVFQFRLIDRRIHYT